MGWGVISALAEVEGGGGKVELGCWLKGGGIGALAR